jgi:tripartite-type tricarboxylate transporter receptor subunit TctC
MLLLGICVAALAQAQQPFPSRPVTFVLPSAPGDPTDLVARVLQPGMAGRLGQQVIVENRPGGSAVIASSAVAKAPPDGHTLLFALSAHSINPIALRSLPYDTFRDFAAVSLLTRFPLIVGARLRAFIDASKRSPGAMNFASPGAGTLSFLVGEEINQRSRLNAVHLAFKGGAPAVQAMIAGDAQYGALPLNLFAPHFKSGRLKPLAVTSAARSPQLPGVPTVAESGFPDFEAYNWIGAFAPAGTPAPVIERLQRDFAASLGAPDARARLGAVGFEIVASGPKALDDFVRREYEHWSRFAREFDVKFD